MEIAKVLNRLNGWQRIGIVLSLIAIAYGLYIGNDVINHRQAERMANLDRCREEVDKQNTINGFRPSNSDSFFRPDLKA